MRGSPKNLVCRSCKGTEDLVTTGNSRVASTYGKKHNVQLIEVKHSVCGKVFWTNHSEAVALFNNRPKQAVARSVSVPNVVEVQATI